jgi:hypothetical protein
MDNADLRREYAQRDALECSTPILWNGTDPVRTARRIFYWDGDRQFLEPYIADVLNIKVSHPTPAPNPYIGGVPPPTG